VELQLTNSWYVTWTAAEFTCRTGEVVRQQNRVQQSACRWLAPTQRHRATGIRWVYNCLPGQVIISLPTASAGKVVRLVMSVRPSVRSSVPLYFRTNWPLTMIFTLPSVGVADIVMSISVCLCVCLFVRACRLWPCLGPYLTSSTRPKVHNISQRCRKGAGRRP